MKTLIFYSIILISFASCKKYDSTELNQSDIRQSYTVRYNRATNSTYVFAQFNKGGFNRVILQSPSTVRFNNVSLSYNSLLSGYEGYFNGDLSNGQFMYVNNNSQIFSNSAPFVTPLILNNLAGFYLDKTRPFTFGLGGFGNDNSNYQLVFAGRTFNASNSFSGPIINIEANQLADINNGYYFGNFVKSRQMSLQQSSGAGGQIKIEYVSDNFSIQVY